MPFIELPRGKERNRRPFGIAPAGLVSADVVAENCRRLNLPPPTQVYALNSGVVYEPMTGRLGSVAANVVWEGSEFGLSPRITGSGANPILGSSVLPTIGSGQYSVVVCATPSGTTWNTFSSLFSFNNYDPEFYVEATTNRVKIYDGSVAGYATTTITPTSRTPFVVGYTRQGTGTNGVYHYYNGAFDGNSTHGDSLPAVTAVVIGGSSSASEWCACRFHFVGLWAGVALTDAENAVVARDWMSIVAPRSHRVWFNIGGTGSTNYINTPVQSALRLTGQTLNRQRNSYRPISIASVTINGLVQDFLYSSGLVNYKNSITPGLITFNGLTPSYAATAIQNYVRSVAAGTLAFSGETPNYLAIVKQDYVKLIDLGLLGLVGSGLQFSTTARRSRSAASRLGLYSGVDVWSTPLVTWAEKQELRPVSTKVISESLLDDFELRSLQEEIAELEKLLDRSVEELKETIKKTEFKAFERKVKQEKRAIEKKLKAVYRQLMQDEEDIILMMLL